VHLLRRFYSLYFAWKTQFKIIIIIIIPLPSLWPASWTFGWKLPTEKRHKSSSKGREFPL